MSDLKLHSKLVKVGQTVTHVEKDGRNDFHKYDFASANAVLAVIRKPLYAEGVSVTPSILSIEDREYTTSKGKASVVTTVTVKYTFVDSETGEREECVYAGRGDDNADKGLSKALTSAAKTFIIGAFLLPTGDDPEADRATDERAADRQTQAQAANRISPVMYEALKTKFAEAGAPQGPLTEWLKERGVPVGESIAHAIASLSPELGRDLMAWFDTPTSVVDEAKAKLAATEVTA